MKQLKDPSLLEYLALLDKHLGNASLIKLVLSKYRGADQSLQRITIRPIELRGETVLSCVYSHKTNDITKNFSSDEIKTLIADWLGLDFKSAHLYTAEQEIQCEISKKGKVTVRTKTNQGNLVQPMEHNREKKRFVDMQRPFLTALGVTDEQHKVIPAMSRKWKQINKFIEIFNQALSDSPLSQSVSGENERPIQVVDFGSGKGYLTFAIHDYLRDRLHNEAQVTGVELRESLAKLCNDAAQKLDHQGLSFVCGDVKTHAPKQTDVMIALHACDVATDYAIHYGIRANASIIMCSPCCHKQIRPQMKSPELLNGLLQYGVHMGQEAEMVTDALRALLLEANGYHTKIFEFVSLEHTNKNKMILAVKKKSAGSNLKALQQIAELKSFYGIEEQCLESLLMASKG